MSTSRLAAAAAAIAATTALAACGSHPSRASRSSGRPTEAQLQRDGVAFAGCMRTHGVPSFPDPTSPGQLKESLSPSTTQTPAFRSAQAACAHLLPDRGSETTAQDRARIPAELAFAHCLRSHGFPRFPDPTSGGQLTHEMLAAVGIDQHDPALIRAADACVGVTHGKITKADVARFAAGQ
jgi:hypothetical protein